jgi:VanZ family protein
MGALGGLVVVIALSWLLANFWLALCRVIPPLRTRIGLCYALAVAVAYLWLLLPPGGPDVIDVLGCTVTAGIVVWQYLRAVARIRREDQTGKG